MKERSTHAWEDKFRSLSFRSRIRRPYDGRSDCQSPPPTTGKVIETLQKVRPAVTRVSFLLMSNTRSLGASVPASVYYQILDEGEQASTVVPTYLNIVILIFYGNSTADKGWH
jgi:hypothetical protein